MRTPMLFIGHGSPMNAITNNEITQSWKHIATQFTKPKAILAISAHWYQDKTAIQDNVEPKQIYDMYGFPEKLYQLKYPVQGSQSLSQKVQQLLLEDKIIVDNSWGIDHGVWSILTHIYPQADIPVVQLSINRQLSPQQMYQIGKKLAILRQQGFLILASGNIVHNLSLLNWQQPSQGEEWAIQFDQWVSQQVLTRNIEELFHYSQQKNAKLAVPTAEHFAPLFYCLGAADPEDKIQVFNQSYAMGSLSMTSYLWQ